MNDRGVSEVLGFVLVFALVTGTIGVVYSTGFSGLQDAQQAEKVNNIDRAFDVLADNFKHLYRHGAPGRATEIKVSDGQIVFGDADHITLRATNTSNSSDNVTIPTVARPITYSSDERDTEIVYSAGAIFRTDRDRTVMLSEPDWIVTSDYMLVPFVATIADGDKSSIGGESTVLVVGSTKSRGIKGEFEPNGSARAEVNVTVESSRAEAWNRYLDSLPHDGFPPDDDASDGEVTYTFTVDRVHAPETIINVALTN